MRTQSLFLQVWVALVCAIGAGFSGDLMAHHPGHGSHSGRHSRGSGHRSSRGVNRDGNSDHSVEVDLPPASDHDDIAAELSPLASIAPRFVTVAWAPVFRGPVARVAQLLALPARAPPSFS